MYAKCFVEPVSFSKSLFKWVFFGSLVNFTLARPRAGIIQLFLLSTYFSNL